MTTPRFTKGAERPAAGGGDPDPRQSRQDAPAKPAGPAIGLAGAVVVAGW
jgi:hypothetical protein